MAQFQRNQGSPEFQFWQGPLPNFIPADSAGMTGFRQESVGQGKDLKKIRSTATAKPALCQKEENCFNNPFTHQEYTICRKKDGINLETGLADLPTTELDRMHQNLPEEA